MIFILYMYSVYYSIKPRIKTGDNQKLTSVRTIFYFFYYLPRRKAESDERLYRFLLLLTRQLFNIGEFSFNIMYKRVVKLVFVKLCRRLSRVTG